MTAGADLRLLRAAVFTAVCVALSAAGHVVAGGGGIPLWSLAVAFAAVLAVTAPLAGRERTLPGIATVLAAGQLALHTLFSCGQRAAGPGGPAGGTGVGHGRSSGIVDLAARLLCNEHARGTLSEAEARRIVSDAGLSAGHLTHRAAAGSPAGTGAGPGSGGGAGTSAGAGTGAVHAGHVVDAPLECLRAAAHAALSLLDGPMLIGHLLAALALGWLLRRGEAALWRLVRLARLQAATAGLDPVRALRTAVAYVRALSAGLLPRGPEQTAAGGERDDTAPPSVLLHHSVQRRGPPRATEDLALAA